MKNILFKATKRYLMHSNKIKSKVDDDLFILLKKKT